MTSLSQELQQFLGTAAAKNNLELATDRDIWKAEAERMTSGYDTAQSELAALKHPMNSAQMLRNELAALRAELAMTSALLEASNESHIEWRKKLTAAEQRNTALSSMLFRLAQKGSEVPGFPASLMREARLLLKPTESGASE